MRVIIRGEIINTECEPVVIVFDTDAERKRMASNLTNMQDKEHVRIYAVYDPVCIEGKKLVDDSLKLLGYERGINSFS